MNKIVEGKAFVLGNNVDTDQIIPAEHLVYSLTDPEERKLYGKFALSSVPKEKSGLPHGNIPFVREGKTESDYSIIVAGKNFGCGSSREHAPFALREAGTKLIIAESYARIFFRNCVDGGFVIPYESGSELISRISTGDNLSINIEENLVINHSTGNKHTLMPLGDILPIIEAGNIFEYAKINSLMQMSVTD